MFKNTNLLPPVRPRIIRLDTVDSTNNYAMRLIDAGLAVNGEVVLAERQTAGKGQRGKSWQDTPGESLLMSLILAPGVELSAQPLFLSAVATAVADVVKRHLPKESVTIKWPNDILVAAKKAGGILIENIVRGGDWQWSVVGVGLNIRQVQLPPDLPHAVSLRMACGTVLEPSDLGTEIAEAILTACLRLRTMDAAPFFEAYNSLLHRRGQLQAFRKEGKTALLRILEMDTRGMLELEEEDGRREYYSHGSVEWLWD